VTTIAFWTCAVLCAVYALTTMFIMWIIDRFKYAKLPFKIKSVVCACLYALLMSLPVMPFVYAPHELQGFSVQILSWFALSNLVWQTIFLSIKYKTGISKFLLPLSVSNVLAWTAIWLVNMHWFGAIAGQVTVLLVQQQPII